MSTNILTIPIKNNFTPVKRTIFKGPKSGVECIFIQLTSNKGIKIFRDKGEAERSCKRQTRAYRFGLAPKVLSRVKKCYAGNLFHLDENNILDNSEMYCYCYITQVAKTRGRFSAREIEKLEDRALKVSMPVGDLHEGNIGVLKGKLVMIDFGDESWNN